MKKLFLIPLMACLVCLSVGAQNVAKIGNTEYATLSAAFDAVADGQTIVLIDSVPNLSASININKTADKEHPGKSFTFDLNGYTVRFKSADANMFNLYRGSLTVKNSVPGQGGLYTESTYNSNADIFYVYGAYWKDKDPSIDGQFYTRLIVEEGVYFNALKPGRGIGIEVGPHKATTGGSEEINKGTMIYTIDRGTANGVRVDVKGKIDARRYCIKSHGQLGSPHAYTADYYNSVKESFYGTPAPEYGVGDSAASAYIHIWPTAVFTGVNETSSSGIYGGGYARWLIEGSSKAATGLYMKSGQVILNDAQVESTWTGPATTVTGLGGGVESQGNAIVIESNAVYAGQTELTVQGDTKVTTDAVGGVALVEKVDTKSTSKVENITINGGNFTSGRDSVTAENDTIMKASAITISTSTATNESATVVVNGITLDGAAVVGDKTGEAALEKIMSSDVHTTEVKNSDGTTTTIISEGKKPEVQDTWEKVLAAAAANPDSSINWTQKGAAKVIGDSINEISLNLGEFQMISGTGTEEANLQKITVKNKATLHVKQLIMNEYARIEVEVGAKLVVDGEQGINAPSKNNILIKADSSSTGYFLFNPAVASNRHPLAKIDMVSSGYQRSAGDFVWQRFGLPGWTSDVRLMDVDFDVPTFAFALNTDVAPINDWVQMGWYDTFKPFGSYILTTTSNKPGAVYTFKCNVVGNENADLNLYSHYNYFGNSYTAPIDIEELLNDFDEHYPGVSATVYLYDPETNWWSDINFFTLWFEDGEKTIQPMRAFILTKTGEGTTPKVNYANTIWNPMMNPSSPAPSRAMSAPFASARIEIVAADGTKDVVRLVEGSQFSSAMDNGFDAEKLMKDRPSYIYAEGENNKMGILASDNIEGTMLSMATTNQTSFIMNFSNVKDMNYAVKDMLTGTVTDITEGGSYMFSVPEDATVEGRFKIVSREQVVTSIEDVQVENSSKGIYTITGQYVGTDFYALPAGVYVVDGKKVVK